MGMLSDFLRTEAEVRRRNDDGIWELLEETAEQIEWLEGEMTRIANNCPYRNPDCPTCNPPVETAPVTNGLTYYLQLDPQSPAAPMFSVKWDGYWAGLGYVISRRQAVKFKTRRDAQRAMAGIFVGLNGCMKIVASKCS